MARYNHNTKLGTILKDEQSRAIVIKHLGEAALKHPMMPLIKMLTVSQALEFKARTAYPVEVMEKMISELEALE